jgi:hypothetical protein
MGLTEHLIAPLELTRERGDNRGAIGGIRFRLLVVAACLKGSRDLLLRSSPSNVIKDMRQYAHVSCAHQALSWQIEKSLIVDSAANTVDGSEVTEAIAVWASVLVDEVKLLPIELSS